MEIAKDRGTSGNARDEVPLTNRYSSVSAVSFQIKNQSIPMHAAAIKVPPATPALAEVELASIGVNACSLVELSAVVGGRSSKNANAAKRAMIPTARVRSAKPIFRLSSRPNAAYTIVWLRVRYMSTDLAADAQFWMNTGDTALGHLRTFPIGSGQVCSSLGNGQSRMMSARLGAQALRLSGTTAEIDAHHASSQVTAPRAAIGQSASTRASGVLKPRTPTYQS